MASSDHLASAFDRVPVMVIPCVLGRPPTDGNARALADFYGSVLPAVWSFILAARLYGLGTMCMIGKIPVRWKYSISTWRASAKSRRTRPDPSSNDRGARGLYSASISPQVRQAFRRIDRDHLDRRWQIRCQLFHPSRLMETPRAVTHRIDGDTGPARLLGVNQFHRSVRVPWLRASGWAVSKAWRRSGSRRRRCGRVVARRAAIKRSLKPGLAPRAATQTARSLDNNCCPAHY
jgi:hypothetical protein